jgi:hypothetical protein
MPEGLTPDAPFGGPREGARSLSVKRGPRRPLHRPSRASVLALRELRRRTHDLTSSLRGTSPNRPNGDSARSRDTTEPLPCTSGTSSLGSHGLPGTRGTVGALASTD